MGGSSANLGNSTTTGGSLTGTSNSASTVGNSNSKAETGSETANSFAQENQSITQKKSTNSFASSESSNSTEPDQLLALLEQTYTREYDQYLGHPTEEKLATLPDVRDRLLELQKTQGLRTAVIYVRFKPVSTASDQLELLLVTAEGQPISRLVPQATRSKVLARAREFNREITDRLKIRTSSYLPSAKQLYQWLIAPLEPDLAAQHIQNLVFVMDAGLRSLPISALHSDQGFLVERYSVSLMPSFSLTNPHYRDLKTSEVLAMGASEFINKDERPLPAVPVELSEITPTLWPGKSFLNEAFTLENLKAQQLRQPFRIIHLATHAEFEAGDPSHSYIQLWDTKLQLDQLGQMNWNDPPVDLLVLSSCRTAIGDEQAELGFAGLAIQAGVESTLASLWYVSDEGTLGLMTEFYEQLKTAPFRAEALRQAQVAMIKDQVRIDAGQLYTPQGNVHLPPALSQITGRQLQHPYYWAAFTLVGNPW